MNRTMTELLNKKVLIETKSWRRLDTFLKSKIKIKGQAQLKITNMTPLSFLHFLRYPPKILTGYHTNHTGSGSTGTGTGI